VSRKRKPCSLTLTDDGDGWAVAKCACGWVGPPCPDEEIAAEFYTDHRLQTAGSPS
jgi:hypothetical protein